MRSKLKAEKAPLGAILFLSCAVLGFLLWWIFFKETLSSNLPFLKTLPLVNSILNFATATCLLFAYKAIKRGNKKLHVTFISVALVLSAAFLVSYLVYHHFHGDTKFMKEGLIRIIYFFILISHIIFSIIQIPLILTTLYFAYVKNWDSHRKIARPTFFVWEYVSVTGVLVYILLYRI